MLPETYAQLDQNTYFGGKHVDICLVNWDIFVPTTCMRACRALGACVLESSRAVILLNVKFDCLEIPVTFWSMRVRNYLARFSEFHLSALLVTFSRNAIPSMERVFQGETSSSHLNERRYTYASNLQGQCTNVHLIKNNGCRWVVWNTNIACVCVLSGQHCNRTAPSDVKGLQTKFKD